MEQTLLFAALETHQASKIYFCVVKTAARSTAKSYDSAELSMSFLSDVRQPTVKYWQPSRM